MQNDLIIDMMRDAKLEESWTLYWDQTLGWFWLHLHQHHRVLL